MLAPRPINWDMYRYQGPNGPGAIMLTPALQAEIDRQRRERTDYTRERMRGHNRLMNIHRVAGLGIPAGAALLPAMFTGGAAAGAGAGASGAAGAGWTMPGVTAPVFGGGAATGAATGAAGAAGTAAAGTAATAAPSLVSRIFSSPGFATVVNAGLGIAGMRSQNRAADQARADMLAQQREAIALERQRLEMEARNADLDREDARRLNEAANELRRRELAIAEEERAWTREREELRDSRLAPYRAGSEAAHRRLMQMWGL